MRTTQIYYELVYNMYNASSSLFCRIYFSLTDFCLHVFAGSVYAVVTVYARADSSLAYTKREFNARATPFIHAYIFISLSFPLTDRCNALENCILSSCIHIIISYA